ncbi:uncharacterized protein LOC119730980 [Patiria miniata]|uniref:Uncharacterized protein n=1 Tax=Patiria miniata TaxID=46514 RepID=A0A914A665_PATMI|nr:uncharacterized protein LOC119730182 [Patiria miniata]XP_038059769.1 uncharacterized protein LOC119730810 [Patiria miniata]XP_038059966.1 uncharacterized protein LOC119730968 isoform X2 [Patiria miniata]XP_038059988.1 uncharacterized protein LOC119730980 [Patiria miniata]
MATTNAPPSYVAAPQPVGQQQLVTVQPAAGVTFGTVNPQPRSGNWKGIVWTGIIQVVLGSLTVILGIVTLTEFGQFFFFGDIGSPIWCGILFYVVAGILGIVSGCKKHSGVAVGYMVMSILACLAACCVIGFGAAMMAIINQVCHPIYTRYRYDYTYGYRGQSVSYYDDPPSFCYLQAAVNAVYAILIILALVEFVVAIIGASMTCGPLCSGGSATQTVIQYQAQPHLVVATQPQGPAFYNIAGQPQVAYPAQQGQYPQAQAPPTAYPAQQGQYPQAQAAPTGEQQYKELVQ